MLTKSSACRWKAQVISARLRERAFDLHRLDAYGQRLDAHRLAARRLLLGTPVGHRVQAQTVRARLHSHHLHATTREWVATGLLL